MVLNSSIASIYVLIGTFDSLVTFVGMNETLGGWGVGKVSS